MSELKEKTIAQKLQEPFATEDIEWRADQSGFTKDGKPWVMVLAYVTNRAIMQRLDEVFGIENWQNEFAPAPDGGVMCGIKVKTGDTWVVKWDGAENTKYEAIKGGLSGAMKRAAVQWGIGRYLYRLETKFVEVSESGQHKIKIEDKRNISDEQKYPTVYGYWTDPILPDWALPKEEKK